MPSSQAFWTAGRISWLEQVLREHQSDAAAQAFLTRLVNCQSVEEQQRLIAEELVPALRYANGESVILWEGQATPTRVVLRDIVQNFLHREGLTENVPTNEADTPDEAAERERLAHLFSQGESAADIVTEDRGPR